jgi:transaldolase/glucose-6-phosphate isomerase
MNRLKELQHLGQSAWLDNLSRHLIRSGDLAKLIERGDVRGMTSNPSIFEKAISQGNDYDDDIRHFVGQGEDVGQIFRHLSVTDIQEAADALRPVYDQSKGDDGFISIEVSPYIAMQTSPTIAEAKSLWAEIARPNLMVKVPGTSAGVPAIRELTAAGLNINITLLFAREMYGKVAQAYIVGLEDRVAKGQDISKIASVASFFVSRIDTNVDGAIAEKLKDANCASRETLEALQGKVAIANAKLAYQQYKRYFSGPAWEKLAAKGARSQRLLWASTGTKNKAYPDTLYIDSLIGPDTVNTMPPETMDAFRDHGRPAETIETDLDSARQALADLQSAGISFDVITDELVVDGVDLFAHAADKLYGALAEKREKILDGSLARISVTLSESVQITVDDEIKSRAHDGATRMLWAKDKALWTGADEDQWLGWLDIAGRELDDLARLREFAKSAHGLSDVVLLGMGGSSLGADVLAEVFGRRAGWPGLHVLDSTDPEQIASVARKLILATTLFVVSSKSGSTLEPNILKDYFFDLVKSHGGETGKQFVAITDPGSSLEKTAKSEGFAHIFHGDPAIGGRFSVLSKFGMVPAAAMGLDVERLLKEAQRMAISCRAAVPPAANPGVKLGIVLGTLAAKCGRDKVTIMASRALESVGTWLEQLIAESTGKHGNGLIPITGEPLGAPDVYGDDRVFVHLHLAGTEDDETQLRALAERGHPVIRISVEDSYQLGQIFYLWEIAIALAAAVIDINPFDQPDVEASKIKTRQLSDQYEKSGSLARQEPIFSLNGFSLYADGKNKAALRGSNSLAQILRVHLDRIEAGDYFALLAYLEPTAAHKAQLGTMRLKVRDKKNVATCAEFGPRYLHSTGQAYKGGPNSGVFLAITCDHKSDLPIPGRKASFGTIELAEALGDFAVLGERGRRALRIHLSDANEGLVQLAEAMDEALN